MQVVTVPPIPSEGYPPERRASMLSIPRTGRMTRRFTDSAVVLCLATLGAETYIVSTQPNNVAAITALAAVTGPVIVALVAAAVRGVSVVTDGQTQQLLQAHGEVERLKGLIEGLKANPGTNLQ